MGRDRLGAASVNVAPSDLPHDVYADVAALIDKFRSEDDQNGDEVAKSLRGCINRKVRCAL